MQAGTTMSNVPLARNAMLVTRRPRVIARVCIIAYVFNSRVPSPACSMPTLMYRMPPTCSMRCVGRDSGDGGAAVAVGCAHRARAAMNVNVEAIDWFAV